MMLTLSPPLRTETSLTMNSGGPSSISSNFSPETSPRLRSTIFTSNPSVSRQRRASIKGRFEVAERATREVYSVRAPEQAPSSTAATPIHGETGWRGKARTSRAGSATSTVLPHPCEPASGDVPSRFSNQWCA